MKTKQFSISVCIFTDDFTSFCSLRENTWNCVGVRNVNNPVLVGLCEI